MDIHRATRAFESWLARQVQPVRADLRLKHQLMAQSPFIFLRGTFYRWLQRWPTLCPTLTKAPRLVAVGDLHVENFGTWRDTEGRLSWGVNDVDETCTLPYTQDLVRLATSALLAAREERLMLSLSEICTSILDGYYTSLSRGGRPYILAERSTWLRDIATGKARDPVEFWTKLEALPDAPDGVAPERVLRAAMPDPRQPCRFMRRIAGVGSLGRPRFVAVAQCGGGFVAREAKTRLPSAAVWLELTSETGPSPMQKVLERAVRMQDPFMDVQAGWVVRRLAPDCCRVELSDLPRVRDEDKLLRAMGWETANMHLGTPNRQKQITEHLAHQPKNWLNDAAKAMAQAVGEDWREWKREYLRRHPR